MKVTLDKGAYMPTKAHPEDAGFDLYAKEDVFVGPSCVTEFKRVETGTAVVDTGVHVQLPKGTCGLLVSKSGLNFKYDILTTGLIDEGYTGSIKVKVYNHNDEAYLIKKGEKVSQLVVLPVVNVELEETDTLEESSRGNDGFGSSGK